jgi:glycosyltransferase involved in cell wall biosynthesis
MNKPFFSVVIPTRGRIQAVDWAIRSVLDQTFTDLECVVVDNNMDDRIDTICAQFNDSRVRQVKTGGLSMPDNFDAAYQNARGTYVCLIEDRQCLYRHALKSIHDLAQREELNCLVWYFDTYEEGVSPTNARVLRCGGDRSIIKVRSDDALDVLAGRNPTSKDYFHVNAIVCIVRASLLESIRTKTGLKICEPVSCDIMAGYKIMNELEDYHYFKGSLCVRHSDHLSNGGNFHKNKNSINEFWNSIGGKEVSYSYVPIKACFNDNTAFNDYLRASATLGGRLLRHPIDRDYYYIKTMSGLLNDKKSGIDRSEEMAAWRKAIALEPFKLRWRVKSHLRKQTLRRVLKDLRVRLGLRALERMLKKKKIRQRPMQEHVDTLPNFMVAESTKLAKRDEKECGYPQA